MKEHCSLCKREPVFTNTTGQALCKLHLKDQTEKRVRKDLRLNPDFNPESLFSLDITTPQGRFTKDLLPRLFPNLQFSEEAMPLNPLIMEEVASMQFELFLKKESPELPGLYPLRTLSIDEFNILSEESLDDTTNPLLKRLKEQQPDTIFAISKLFRNW